eukprot:6490943-Amphidinium_carterae.1
MMETLLYNLLEAGEEGKDQVLALAKMALALLDDEEQVDFGEIDDGVAKLLLEQRSVWVTMRQQQCAEGSFNNFEEHVKKLKAAGFKSSATHSIVSLIGTKIQAEPFWKEQLHRYIVESPTLLEYVPTMKTNMVALASMACTHESCLELHNMAKGLHFIKQGLRPIHVQKYEKALQKITANFVVKCQSRDAALTEKDILNICTALTPVVVELCTLDPDNGDLRAVQTELTSMLQQVHRDAKWGDVLVAVADIQAALASPNEEREKIDKCCSALRSLVSSSFLMGMHAAEEELKKIEATWAMMLKYAAKHAFSEQPSLSQLAVEGLIALCMEMPQGLSFISDETNRVTSLFEHASGLLSSYQKLCPTPDTTDKQVLETDPDYKQLAKVQTCLLRVQKAMDNAMALALEPVLVCAITSVQTYLDMTKKRVSAIMHKITESAQQRMEIALSELSKKAGGRDGGNWKDNIKEGWGWDEMEPAFVNGELLTVHGTELVRLIGAAEEVLSLNHPWQHCFQQTVYLKQLNMRAHQTNILGKV